MQKRYKGITFLVGLISLSFFFFLSINIINAETDNLNPKKGDLQCPKDSKTNCIETRDANGNVTSVTLTYDVKNEDGEFIVNKIVTKKSTLGHYDVKFEVKGNGVKQIPSSTPAYIAVIVDMSVTATNQKEAMMDAVQKFGSIIVPVNDASSYQLALLKFGASSAYGQVFSNKNFSSANFKGGLGSTSHIELSLNEVYKKYKTLPPDMKKYVIIFGDGRYWYSAHTDTSKAIKNANNLKDLGTKIYGIRYNGSCKSCKMGQYNAAIRLGCKKGESYYSCDEVMMKKLVNEYRAPSSDLTGLFEDIADDILKETGELSITTDLKDNLGDEFYLTDDTNRYKEYNVGKLTSEGTVVGPFEIEIDQYASRDWHKTNNNFTLEYTKENGEKKTLLFDDNPEVYWIPTDLTIHSCSGSVTADSFRDDSSDEYSFYKKVCNEGYLENNEYISGFQASVKVNNSADGVDKFDLKAGLGFPTAINLKTNIMCDYRFDVAKFQQKYTELEEAIAKTQAESVEWYRLVNERNEKVLKALDTYLEMINGKDLEEYAGRFQKQSASMTIKYTDNKTIDTVSFENVGDAKISITCSPESRDNTVTVLGKKVIFQQNCKGSFEKNMQLKTVCLNMKTGEAEDCLEDGNQIAGGNNFYIKLQQTGGNVSVNIPNAGYRENLDINLKKVDNELGCDFTASKKIDSVVYRQIDIADPFIRNYNGSRKIGENFLNTINKGNSGYKYNFVNIIKSDLWEENNGNLKYEPAYSYQMGKQNIVNIRSDTAEEGVSSYLGKNCYFNANNLYICNFPRNITSDDTVGDQEWFFKYKVNANS